MKPIFAKEESTKDRLNGERCAACGRHVDHHSGVQHANDAEEPFWRVRDNLEWVGDSFAATAAVHGADLGAVDGTWGVLGSWRPGASRKWRYVFAGDQLFATREKALAELEKLREAWLAKQVVGPTRSEWEQALRGKPTCWCAAYAFAHRQGMGVCAAGRGVKP